MQNRIKELINSKNISQEDFSRALNINKASISHWCNQKHQPDLPALVKISEQYKVDILWLAGY